MGFRVDSCYYSIFIGFVLRKNSSVSYLYDFSSLMMKTFVERGLSGLLPVLPWTETRVLFRLQYFQILRCMIGTNKKKLLWKRSTWHPVLIYSFDLICSHPLINEKKKYFSSNFVFVAIKGSKSVWYPKNSSAALWYDWIKMESCVICYSSKNDVLLSIFCLHCVAFISIIISWNEILLFVRIILLCYKR